MNRVASKIERLKDNNGNIIYPLTTLDAVYYSDTQTAKQYIDASIGSGGDTTWKDVKTEGQFYKSDEAPSSTTVGKYDGYFYATRVYNAVYNDYAELFHCVRPISVGHLAYATKEGVTCAGKPKTAIGIVSDCYGHLLGGEGNPDDPNFVPIAVAGRVPIEIKGNIEIGDMVQATKNGLGKKAHRFTNRNKIIGKVVGLDPKGRNNYMEVLVGGM